MYKESLQMEVWSVPPVEEEPSVSMTSWRIIPVKGGQVLFGWREDGTWRRSSLIRESDYNIRTREWTFITHSGRKYILAEEDRRSNDD